MHLPDGKTVNLTHNLGVAFHNEDTDTPSQAPAYGATPWTPDEKQVLLTDRYDQWLVNVDGSGARCLTAGLGRQTQEQNSPGPARPRGKDARSQQADADSCGRRGHALDRFLSHPARRHSRKTAAGALQLHDADQGQERRRLFVDVDVVLRLSRFAGHELRIQGTQEGQQCRRPNATNSTGARPS